MKAELINPFLNATLHVLTTMCSTKPVSQKPRLKESNSTWGIVTGIIGMTSGSLSGNMVLSFDEQSAIAIVNRMLSVSYTTITPDIVDAVGELTNMISGGAKRHLSDLGYNFNMATPVMVTGQGITITQLSHAPVIQIPFSIEQGEFVVEANLTEAVKPVSLVNSFYEE